MLSSDGEAISRPPATPFGSGHPRRAVRCSRYGSVTSS